MKEKTAKIEMLLMNIRDEGGHRSLCLSSKMRQICCCTQARLVLTRRQQKEMNPRRAAQGDQLEQSVISTVQRHDGGFVRFKQTLYSTSLKD